MHKDKVLILDSCTALHPAIISTLHRAGYELNIAKDYVEGLQAITSNDYQLVINRENPTGTAWLACLQIRQLSNIPIIVISCDKSEQALVTIVDAGADYFLSEPLDPLELAARINALIRRNKLNEELNIRRARAIARSRLN